MWLLTVEFNSDSNKSFIAIKHCSKLNVYKIGRPPVSMFKPSVYVNSRFFKGRHLATDTKNKKRNREDVSEHNLMPIWKLL
jgi:hypothetical protein